MATGSGYIPQQVTVTVPDTYVAVPNARTTFNQFDEHGLLVSLQRLRGESNWAYKRRILDVFVNQAGSNYRGLVNGITRELGLSLYQPITINPKINADGNFLAADPYIKFDGVYLYLYSDYSNDTLDWTIDCYQQGGNYEHLGSLVDLINKTYYFHASLTSESYRYTRSSSILNQSNRILVPQEAIPASTKFKVDHARLAKDDIYFNNPYAFNTEVDSAGLVTRAGKYHIDYTKGIFTTYSIPTIDTAIRYKYIDYPFYPVASDIVLHNINNDNFRTKMFEQVLQDDGTYEHGLPTELGTDIINELMSVVPMYWGI